MMPRMIILFGFAVVTFSVTGCGLFGPRIPNGKIKPRPEVTSDDRPTAEMLVGYLKNQSDVMTSVETRDLTIDARSQGSSVSLDGQLICQKPRHFRLVGRKFGNDEIVVGSNQDRFWFFIKRDPSDALFHCSYTDYEKGVELPFPFQPEWVLEALGMADPGSPDKYRLEEDPGSYHLIEESTFQGRAVRKVTVFHRGRANGDQPQVVSRTVYDMRNKVICRAAIREVYRYSAVNAQGRTVTAALPRIVELDWPGQDTRLTLDLGKMQVNQPRSPDEFQMPRLGRKQVDIGLTRPTGRISLTDYR